MEIGAIPGGVAHGDIIGVLGRNIGVAAHRIGPADLIAAAALGRIGIGGDPGRYTYAIFGGAERGTVDRGPKTTAAAGRKDGRDKGREGDKANGMAPGGRRHGTQYSTLT